MGIKDDGGKPREGERDVVPPVDASARDSVVGDAANHIDPDMGTPEGGTDPVEPKSQE